MCGIVGYIGTREAYPIIIKGLKRLEYRGYDSAGVALLNGDMTIFKKAGKVKDLELVVAEEKKNATIGIGHTRWATHGEPNDRNAHPHISHSGNLAIIHNGIIENYASIKEMLVKRGYVFHSDTDTEVLVNLIEEVQIKEETTLDNAVRIALNEVVGAYAIAVLDRNNPDQLIAARKGSPLVIGVGENELFIASDATPIIEYTKNVIYLDDKEYAVVNRDGSYDIRTLGNVVKSPEIKKIEFSIETIEKGGFEHFMLKEIYEQPKAIEDSLRGRMNALQGWIKLGGTERVCNAHGQCQPFPYYSLWHIVA